MPGNLPPHLRRLEAEVNSHHARGGFRISRSGDVVFDRQGLQRDAACRAEGVSSRAAAIPAAACRHDLEVPEMIAFRDETARRLGLDLRVHINQDGLARGINPIASGSQVHTQVMKTEAPAPGARRRQVRRGVRRRAARRGEEPRQGAHLLAPLRRPRLGPAQSAPRTVAPVQHAHPRGRVDAGVPAVELDRTRRLGIHPAPRTSPSCRSISPSRARWSSAPAR